MASPIPPPLPIVKRKNLSQLVPHSNRHLSTSATFDRSALPDSSRSYSIVASSNLTPPVATTNRPPAFSSHSSTTTSTTQFTTKPTMAPVATSTPAIAPDVSTDPQVRVLSTQGKRILCVAEIRGQLSKFNTLAKKYNASCIIHTGNFGFFDSESIGRISLKIIKQLCVFSPLLDASKLPEDPEEIKRNIPADALSELPSFLNGTLRLEVPVYTIYGVAEDLIVLERFKDGTYNVPNLHIIDETTTHAIKAPSGLTLRLFGLGGSLVNHRLFDHGDASLSIAGSPGVMWTTTLQMGHLISTVRKSFVLSEIRIFVTHPSPSREGLLAQLAVALRTDFTISSGLHFLYSSSFNEFSALPSIEHFRGILALARAQFMDLWNAVKAPLFSLVDDIQNQQLTLAYEVFEAMPSSLEQPTPSAKTINGAVASNTTSSLNTNESIEYLEVAFRNMWHFNLCDHSNGAMVLAVNGSRVSSESYSEGFNFEYRFAPSNSASASNPAGALASKAVDVSVPKNGSATRQSPSSANVKPVRTILRNPASISAKSDNKPKAASPVQTSAAIASSSTSEAKPSNTGTTSTSTQQATIAPQEPELPGVWVANGKVDKEEVKGYFDEEDRKFIKSVVTKGNYVNPEKMFALVYFSTQDEASQALSRIDREKAGRCSLIRHSHSNEFGPSNQASNGSGRGHRSTPSSTGWSTAGSTRGGRGSYRGRGGSGAPSSFSKSSSGRLGTSPKISHSQTVAPSASPAPTTVKPASKPADSAPATQN